MKTHWPSDADVGFANLVRVWNLPAGMAIDVDQGFMASIAWLDQPSILFGRADVAAAVNKLQEVHGVRVIERDSGGYSIYRSPAP